MFTVFSDRIEILSRGTLAPEQTLEGFFAGESVPVNSKLSEIFLQLHISEKTGRGVPIVTRRYGRELMNSGKIPLLSKSRLTGSMSWVTEQGIKEVAKKTIPVSIP